MVYTHVMCRGGFLVNLSLYENKNKIGNPLYLMVEMGTPSSGRDVTEICRSISLENHQEIVGIPFVMVYSARVQLLNVVPVDGKIWKTSKTICLIQKNYSSIGFYSILGIRILILNFFFCSSCVSGNFTTNIFFKFDLHY